MSRPLPEPVVFLDECLGVVNVAKALRAAGMRVEVLVDHFPSGTADEVWLPEIGKRGWVVFTKDTWIRRRELERRALMGANVAAFVLTAGDLTSVEMAAAFARAYPRVRKLLRDYTLPLIAAVNARGRVRLLTTTVRRAGKKKGRG